MTRGVVNELFERQVYGDRSLARRVWRHRSANLELSLNKTIKSEHTGPLTWFDLESVHNRYLLAGAADASIAVYDVLVPSSPDEANPHVFQQHKAVLYMTKHSNPDSHKFTVTTVGWYPVDTGIFVSGSFDKTVKVWNTNTLEQLCQFNLGGKVYCLALSPIATSHQLVAVGTEEHMVRLCDLATGGFTHTLNGHRDGVWAVSWSLVNEFQVVTGSCDGQVRLWDVRRATGALHVFDQEATTKPQPQTRKVKRRASGGNRNTRGGGVGPPSSSNAPPSYGSPNSPAANINGSTNSPAANFNGSTNSRALAHNGCVTYIHPTSDGLHWITAANDSRVRVWDTAYKTNLLINFPQTFNSARKARQICTTDDGQLLFHPSGSIVQLFDVKSGQQLKVLRGGFDTINALAYNPATQELYCGANDRQILVWSPSSPGDGNISEDTEEDNWSD